MLRRLPWRDLLMGVVTASVLAALLSGSVVARGTPHAAPAQAASQGGLEAGVGLAWAAGGIASAVAVTISPDPVSKLAIFGAYANAAAGVGAAILSVRDAWNCHYDLMYAPVSWTGLRIDRPQFVLKPVFTGPIWA